MPPRAESFDSIDPVERTMAIERAARSRDQTAIPDLIRQLDSQDAAIRMLTIATLRDLTGQDLGFDPTARAADREVAIVRWHAWWADHRGSPDGPRSASPGQGTSGRYNPQPTSGVDMADRTGTRPLPADAGQ